MKIIFYSFILLITISCNNISNEVEEIKESHDIGQSIELADRYIVALMDLQYDTLPFMLAPKAIFYGPGISDSSDFAESLILWKSMRDWFDHSTNLRVFQRNAINDKENNYDWVFIRGIIDGYHEEYDKEIELYVFADFKIVDKKIAQVNVCWDGLDLLTQLGYILKAPQ